MTSIEGYTQDDVVVVCAQAWEGATTGRVEKEARRRAAPTQSRQRATRNPLPTQSQKGRARRRALCPHSGREGHDDVPSAHAVAERRRDEIRVIYHCPLARKPHTGSVLTECYGANRTGRSARAGRGLAWGASLFTAWLTVRIFLVCRCGRRPHPEGAYRHGRGGAAAAQSDPGSRRDRHARCAERWADGDRPWQWLSASRVRWRGRRYEREP